MNIIFKASEKKERDGLITLEGYYIIQANSLFNTARLRQIINITLYLAFNWEYRRCKKYLWY
jgi:hypothetical protein